MEYLRLVFEADKIIHVLTGPLYVKEVHGKNVEDLKRNLTVEELNLKCRMCSPFLLYCLAFFSSFDLHARCQNMVSDDAAQVMY